MKPRAAAPARVIDPDETRDLEELMAEVIPDHEVWKVTPNPRLGARRPIDLIGSPYEHVLRNMLRAAKYGMFS